MTSKICFLLGFIIVTIQGWSQTQDIPKGIVDSYHESHSRHVRFVSNRNVVPWESYAFDKKSNVLIGIDLLYPNRRLHGFWITHDKLVRIKSLQLPEKRKQRMFNDYYFSNESLVYKKENYKDSLSVDDLRKLYEDYKAKAMTQ